jgi:MtrB/PioB family decaheme-associated outer membrane protein
MFMNAKLIHRLPLGLMLAAGSLPQATTAVAAEDAVPFTGWVDVGLGYVSDAPYRFSRYSGLETELYPVVGFQVEQRDAGPNKLEASGSLDSRSVSVEYGRQGLFNSFLSYDQLPYLKSETAVTVFDGVGTENLTDSGVLQPLDLETERQRLSAGVSYHPRANWKVSLSARQEHKDGTDWIGGAIRQPGHGGGGGFAIGAIDSALLPEPIDQTTTNFDASVEYSGERSQLRLNLHGSYFENEYSFLQWETPTIIGITGQEGQMALAPDNSFLQASLSGSHLFGETTRLTAVLTAGRMEQDEAFLPYTAGGDTSFLPTDSLDGEVNVYGALIRLTSRPMDRLRLSAKYRYDERDNQTPQWAFPYVILDSDATSNPVRNEPLSYVKQKFSLDANYRFNNQWRALAGYDNMDTERVFSDVESNREHVVRGALKWRPRDDFDATLRLFGSHLEPSAYQAESSLQNPLLRKYYLANRERLQGGILLNYAPSPALTVGVSADVLDDNYPDTELGLTDTNGQIFGLDVTYVPSEDVQWHAFYSRDQLKSTQLGSEGGDTADWTADIEDTVDTLGVGVKFVRLWPRWDVGVDYLMSRGRGDITQTSTLSAPAPFPTLENDLQRFQVAGDYHWSDTTQLRLAAYYERLDAEDWTVDGVPTTLVTADNGTLLLGNESEDYDVVGLVIAVRHHF